MYTDIVLTLLIAIDLQQGVSPSEALQSLPDTHKGAIEDNGPVIRTRSLLTDVPSWTTDREDVSLATSIV